MKKYLLDTDICIFFLKGKYQLVDKIDATGIDKCLISEITIGELLFGAENSTNYAKHIKEVEYFESQFEVLKIYDSLRFYAKEKARLRKIGETVAEFDLLIGAIAVTNNLIMVTRNQKHFKKIEGIEIEDWTKSRYNQFIE